MSVELSFSVMYGVKVKASSQDLVQSCVRTSEAAVGMKIVSSWGRRTRASAWLLLPNHRAGEGA
jgi:hypothetical protein